MANIILRWYQGFSKFQWKCDSYITDIGIKSKQSIPMESTSTQVCLKQRRRAVVFLWVAPVFLEQKHNTWWWVALLHSTSQYVNNLFSFICQFAFAVQTFGQESPLNVVGCTNILINRNHVETGQTNFELNLPIAVISIEYIRQKYHKRNAWKYEI